MPNHTLVAGRTQGRLQGIRRNSREGIPGAVCYETPKQWNVSGPGKKYLNLNKLLNALPTFRSALEVLHADLTACGNN